MQRC
jgi:hypothetical protein